VSAKNNDTSDILRNFKKFTSKEVINVVVLSYKTRDSERGKRGQTRFKVNIEV
jgi:hypothetical protein